jgi:hypothetical protein
MVQRSSIMTSNAGSLEKFERTGFVVVRGALAPEYVSAFNHSIDQYLKQHPDEWVHFNESLAQTVNVLPHTADFDSAIENPITLSLLRKLIGENVAFEEFSIIIRRPTARAGDMKGWHRDIIRDFDRRMEIQAISVIFYLTDVTENDHCFSIIPETHNRLVDLRPEDVSPGSEFDVTGPAGTALLFHARCLHSGKLKPRSRERRTLHIYYSRSELPRTSEWSDIPPRLYQKAEAKLPPLLYSKWNVSEVLEGTGKKPRDLSPTLSSAEMIKEVQRRANRMA